MPASLRCPRCEARLGLDEPYPAPDSRIQCPACGGPLTVRYPDAVRARVIQRRIAGTAAEASVTVLQPGRPMPVLDREAALPSPPHAPDPEAPTRLSTSPGIVPPPPPSEPDPEDAPAPPRPAATRSPRKAPVPTPTPPRAPESPSVPSLDADALSTADDSPPSRFDPATASPAATQAPPEAFDPATESGLPDDAPPPTRRRGRRWLTGLLVLIGLGAVAAGGAWMWLRATYGTDLPDVAQLEVYRPPGVTRVLDRRGELLGEIYEQRRYLLAWDDIPPVVRDAFVAAEDANFWHHDGLDYLGIGRAAVRNLAAGRWAQGGSTITQQVAKNFLLSNRRALERKVREAFVSWRIEQALPKERILYLYLNEIYLGSQAYGVEAAARTFFGKPVAELHLGQVAVLAGLPPRPSKWNPHASLEAALRRQAYVLDRMVTLEMITADQAAEAIALPLDVVPRRNTFREIAPWCTEAARRELVERLGDQTDLLARGVTLHTTCDLGLQQHAQDVVRDGVAATDQRMGLRREGVETLSSDAAIEAHIAAHEAAMVEAQAVTSADLTASSQSTLTVGDVHPGVITEVDKTWARVRVGRHEGIVPLAWSQWVYVPNPDRNYKYRAQDDLTMPVDDDGDRTKDGGILRRGDILPVRVVALSTAEASVSEAFDGTPGEGAEGLVALRLWPTAEVEAALLSFDMDTGAIRAMVGGSDFGRSQLDRTSQARRQVGSTIKPLVYTAAVGTEKLTTASLVADAPLAYGSGEELWKPGNYGGDYKGNLTLRQALALSRNTCTVRVMDAVDPGMGRGVVYDFVRRLGLGGPPLHLLPEDAAPTPDTDWLCPWVAEADAGWCAVGFDDPDAGKVCRACDLSIALGSTSLSMAELLRAYAVLGRGGTWVDPYILDKVVGPDGDVLYEHAAPEAVQVIEPELADIGTWLLQNVVNHGTGLKARYELGVPLAGKTGTTNDEKDAWFVGMSPRVATAVWVGYDQPRPLGSGSTGGSTALPLWIDYMRAVVDREDPVAFEEHGELTWIGIDEATGRRVAEGGVDHPFLENTEPEATGLSDGQASFEDLAMEL